jgi:phosphatidylserine/phosphatidylglycerophosphate/cardiolipin synthase-like enzyme
VPRPRVWSSSLFGHRWSLPHPLSYLLPGRLRELLGVHHMKLYMFDDTIIIGGANLSDIYFTHRQDRYIVIKNNTALTNWIAQLFTVMGQSPYTTTLPTISSSRWDEQRHSASHDQFIAQIQGTHMISYIPLCM